MSARNFSTAEDAILRELYKTKTNKEIADILNNQYSIREIMWRANSLGLHKDPEVILLANKTRTGTWKDWEVDIIKKHYNKDGVQYVQNLLPERTKISIIHKAVRMRIQVSHEIRNYANGPKHHSLESKQKMSESKKGVPFSESHLFNLRRLSPRGEKHHNWKNGRSLKPYGPEFSYKLKLQVKNRDNFTCQRCLKKPAESQLVIHHISYDKTVSNLRNLITLCKACHVYHHHNCTDDKQREEQILFSNYVSKFN